MGVIKYRPWVYGVRSHNTRLYSCIAGSCAQIYSLEVTLAEGEMRNLTVNKGYEADYTKVVHVC